MIAATAMAIFFVPLFYVAVRHTFRNRDNPKPKPPTPDPQALPAPT